MKNWVKSFLFFLLLALSFCGIVSPDVKATPDVFQLTATDYNQAALEVAPTNKEFFFVGQNNRDTAISDTTNNDNYYYLVYGTAESFDTVFAPNKLFDRYKFNNFISHKISPNLDYTVYVRAP